MRFRTMLAASAATLFMQAAQAQERTIIVLDASGSMWGQIDGKPKLEIARESLREVLKSVPADTELGLMAYGHREKGSCTDIELIVPPAKGTESAISTAVDNMKFLGKTPLSAAVRQAAEDLKYTENKATVILITDGLETCEADPCALGKELEQSGVDFTAHVVGFGLTADEGKKVACLAENTGGKYIQASDAAGLKDALKTTVVAQPAPEPEPAPVVDENNVDPAAHLVDGGPAVDIAGAGITWHIFKKNSDGTQGERVATDYDDKKLTVPPGDYVLEANWGQATTRQDLTVKAGDLVKPQVVFNAGRLTITPLSAPGQKADNVTIRFDYPGGTTNEYSEKAVVLPAGDTKVTVTVGAAEASETIALAAGADIKKDIIAGVGVVNINAFYTAGGEKVDSPSLFWEVLKAAKKIDGSREGVATEYGPNKKFSLPAGDYVMRANIQGTTVEQPFAVTVGQATDLNVVLNAGVAAIETTGGDVLRVFEAKKDLQGNRKDLAYEFGDKLQTTLPAGDYVVVIEYKADKPKSETPFTVKAGERTEVKVP